VKAPTWRGRVAGGGTPEECVCVRVCYVCMRMNVHVYVCACVHVCVYVCICVPQPYSPVTEHLREGTHCKDAYQEGQSPKRQLPVMCICVFVYCMSCVFAHLFIVCHVYLFICLLYAMCICLLYVMCIFLIVCYAYLFIVCYVYLFIVCYAYLFIVCYVNLFIVCYDVPHYRFYTTSAHSLQVQSRA